MSLTERDRRRVAEPTPASPPHISSDEPAPIIELTWSALPAALATALGDEFALVTKDGAATIGVTVERFPHGVAPKNGHEERFRLRAWALVKTTGDATKRRTIYTCDTQPANGAAPATFDLAVTDAVHLDVSQNGEAILRFSWIPPVDPSGAPTYWAHTDLPRRLDLRGGVYELARVDLFDRPLPLD
ncbi:MAG: hypothetical protein ACF8PN_07035 [Phycisphaerales bacterium]